MAGGPGGGGDAGGEHAAAAYWYDACEDSASLLCGIDFAASADFDPGLIPAMDCGADDGFVAEIDRILESINAEATPAPPPPPPAPAPAPAPAPVAPLQPQPQLQEAAATVAHNAVAVSDVAQRAPAVEARKEPRREFPVAAANGGDDCRDSKRQRLPAGGTGGPRHDWRRRPMAPPPPSRGWEDRGRGRREYDRPRKRDRDGHYGQCHDHHRRDPRGFWERDRGGKMVFRHGMWEAEADRQGKRARTKDGCPPAENKAEVDRSGKEKPATEEKARQYQLEVLEQAKSRNTIAFLETGAGKTLIAVLLIKSICDKMLKENKKILAVFLVPKVPLVYQQAEVIRERTGYRVGHYCGEMGQDFWDSRKWQREFESKQVKSCAWPYFYFQTIFRYNAPWPSFDQTYELRLVYGVSERTESDGAANLIQKLRAINYALGELGQWCAYKVALSFLTALQNDERANYQVDVKFQESYLRKVVDLLHCQLTEGAAMKSDSNDVEMHNSENPKPNELEEGELPDSHAVSVGEHVDEVIGAAVADGKVTPRVQALIKILLKYQHTEDFRAIIFVERVVTALVLPKVFAELPSLGFIRCASLIGHNNNQEMRSCQMQDTITKFRDGRVTLLVATSVAEEGLDIRQCNVVIRFDLAKTVLAYIQSRGRARKPGSDYILMLERGNMSHEAFLRNARNSEETLRKEAIERTDLSHLDGTSMLSPVDISPDSMYQVESTGAVVSLNSAVGLVHFYCSQLPSDRYSILRPEFIMQKHEKPGGSTEYSCKLQLPCNAPFEKLEGPICSSIRLAQQAVCLAACKKLHEMGAFTDMLLPDRGSGEGEKTEQNDEGDPLPGTARHREFFPEGVAEILHGEWILSGRDGYQSSQFIKLYLYSVNCVNIGTSKDPFVTQLSNFALIFGNELDAEVLSTTMDLFVARTIITKASLVFRGPIEITESQLILLKSFHVRLMSIVLDVDVDPSTTPWDPAKAYLFVPVGAEKCMDLLREIDWTLVNSIVNSDAWNNPLQRARPDVYLGTNERTLGGDRREYGFGKLRHGTAFGQKAHPTYGIRGAIAEFDVVKASGLVPGRGWGHFNDYQNKGKLFMADSCWDAKDLAGMVVTAAHSGKRFYVDSICYNMNAENSFPRKEGYLGPLEYSSFADYYKQKYGVELVYKKQPLIRARGVSYCKNLLSPRFEHSEASNGEFSENLDKTYYVYLPPELCLVHPLPGSLVRGAQRLPSIMRRVESMLLAIQLKDIIGYPVPANKILEALTAASCQETFCYERAELLGDAYLKWVVSRFLFLKYPQKHEGQLTRMRQQMVSNMILYQYALNKNLQSYIQADRFAPSRWAAPGVLPVFDEETRDSEPSIFDEEFTPSSELQKNLYDDYDGDSMQEDGEIEGDSSCYRVLSSKTLADVVEALIGVYYVAGGKIATNHLMKWIGINAELDPQEIPSSKPYNIPESIIKSINFDTLEGALGIKFQNKGLLVEAITHASRPSSGVSCYQRLEFVGDAVLDHLITKHLFFTYTDLPPGRLTDLRAAAVNNENFARVAVKHKLHVHLRHGSSALETQIREFVKDVQEELSKPGFNSFGLGDCKAPKVLGDIFESIAGAIFLDSGCATSVVWKVFQPLLDPMVTPDTLPMHPVRELQERCQQQAEGLEYKASRTGNVATVEVLVDGIQIGVAQNPQKKMAQKLAARNALVVLKEKETAAKKDTEKDGEKKNGSQFTRQTLNDICLRRQWPMPQYRCINEGGPAHAKRFVYAVRVNTSDSGWTDECIGEPMPSVKKAKDSAAVLLLELLNRNYRGKPDGK
ncbi:Endoribonuclease Dicer homolog 1 [Zea mays]|uniref:Endoribonuclease Dicer homolog 1 n=1 Tax=Zea mays TaxID=4577 RepID=UPI00098DDB65|nr:Endoribonuclease Dicer homolog 1 [Zea mays]|eukprot:NP_001335948.1 uncharacterized protein LOC100381417 [Zea mays]